MVKKKINLLCALTLLFLGILDSHSTYLATKNGGIELNPIVSIFLGDDIKFLAFCILKCLFYFFIGYDAKLDQDIEKYVMLFIILALLVTVIRNYQIAKVF